MASGSAAARLVTIKGRVNELSLAPTADFRRDSDLFAGAVHSDETQGRIKAAMTRGLQTREAELDLTGMLGDLGEAS